MSEAPQKRARRANAGTRRIGLKPHAISATEITAAFVQWGIIGELSEERPTPIVLKPAPFIDKGPGVAL